MEESERDELKEFLDEVADLIDEILDERHDWFPPRLRQQLAETWRREVRDAIVTAKLELGKHDSEIDIGLGRVGLTGDQWKVKRAAWRAAKDAALKGPLSKKSRWQKLVDRLAGGLRLLQGALKIADAILESLDSVIPTLEVVSEFKKILEGLLDLHDGQGPLKPVGSWLKRRFRRPPT